MTEDDKNQAAVDYVIDHLGDYQDYATVAEYIDDWAEGEYEVDRTDYTDIQSLIHQKLRELMKYV